MRIGNCEMFQCVDRFHLDTEEVVIYSIAVSTPYRQKIPSEHVYVCFFFTLSNHLLCSMVTLTRQKGILAPSSGKKPIHM